MFKDQVIEQLRDTAANVGCLPIRQIEYVFDIMLRDGYITTDMDIETAAEKLALMLLTCIRSQVDVVIKSIQPKPPTYEQQKAAVRGYIETIPYFTKLNYEGMKYTRGTAYCNEEGKLQGLPINVNATRAWMQSCPEGDPSRMILNGDVIFYAKVKEE